MATTALNLDTAFVDLKDQSAATDTMVALSKLLATGTIPETIRRNEIVQAIIDAGIPELKVTEDPWEKLRTMK